MSADKAHANSILVVVPCGRSKIWSKQPSAGPTLAKNAYIGSPFKVNRSYAEQKGNEWIILSAKSGFISPDFELPGPYEVTFKRKSSGPVECETLKQQVADLQLDQYVNVIGLGGKEYREAIIAAFTDTRIEPKFPFAGLPIGKAMQATKQAVE